jgi:hypothetical protein
MPMFLNPSCISEWHCNNCRGRTEFKVFKIKYGTYKQSVLQLEKIIRTILFCVLEILHNNMVHFIPVFLHNTPHFITPLTHVFGRHCTYCHPRACMHHICHQPSTSLVATCHNGDHLSQCVRTKQDL